MFSFAPTEDYDHRLFDEEYSYDYHTGFCPLEPLCTLPQPQTDFCAKNNEMLLFKSEQNNFLLSNKKQVQQSNPVQTSSTAPWNFLSTYDDEEVPLLPPLLPEVSEPIYTPTDISSVRKISPVAIEKGNRHEKINEESTKEEASSPVTTMSDNESMSGNLTSHIKSERPRRDLIKKTLIRAIKRYFTDKYRSKYVQGGKRFRSDEKGPYLANILGFAEEILSVFGFDKSNSAFYCEAKFLIANLVNPVFMKDLSGKPKSLVPTTKLYNECLMRFTQRRSQRLWKVKVFFELYKCFYSSGELMKFATTDETLSTDIDLYLELAQELVQTS